MPVQKPASWVYTDEFVGVPLAVDDAAAAAAGLGTEAVSPGLGAVLRLLAAAVDARHVVEIGTRGGLTGLWLLEGMPGDGILTTIDADPEQQKAARRAFAQAGVPTQRTRVISGAVADVVTRLADAAYDLVVITGVGEDEAGLLGDHAEQGLRLLRPGGLLVIDHMLWRDRVADPAARDTATATVRELGKALRDDGRLAPALLPVGDGLFVGVRR